METNKTKVLVFEDFNINDLEEEDTECLGNTVIDILKKLMMPNQIIPSFIQENMEI